MPACNNMRGKINNNAFAIFLQKLIITVIINQIIICKVIEIVKTCTQCAKSAPWNNLQEWKNEDIFWLFEYNFNALKEKRESHENRICHSGI